MPRAGSHALMKAILAAVLLTAALAGCLDGDPDGDDGSSGTGGEPTGPQRPTMPEDPMPEGAGHDHTDPETHKFLWNYAFSARDPLLQNQASIAGVHALDLQDGYLFGAVYGSHSASVDGGLVIWDLTDPARPVETGRWTVPGAVGGDRSLEATQDADFAVLATESVDCLGHINPTAVSVYLIDTSDKSLPVVADVISTAGPSAGSPDRIAPSLGEHSVAVHRIAGQDYAFIFGKIFEIARGEGAGAALVDTGARINTGHDIYVRDTPWGDVWALSANGGGGLQVYDVTDPTAPREITAWDLPERQALASEGIRYYFHTADVAFFDDEILIVVSSEDWEDHTSPMWILDATSLDGSAEGDLTWIGTWENPGGHTALGTSFSLHNPRFSHDGVLSISSYHGGLWQMDFRDPSFRADPAEVAYAVYAEGEQTAVQDPVHQTVESRLCGLGLTLDAPTYMDVEVGEDGTLYLADVYMGLYTFTPTAEHPVFGEA